MDGSVDAGLSQTQILGLWDLVSSFLQVPEVMVAFYHKEISFHSLGLVLSHKILVFVDNNSCLLESYFSRLPQVAGCLHHGLSEENFSLNLELESVLFMSHVQKIVELFVGFVDVSRFKTGVDDLIFESDSEVFSPIPVFFHE